MKFSKFSELVNRILSNNHSHRRDMDVTIVVHSPGSIGSTPSVEVQSIHAGFDWDSGKVLIFPSQPLTTLTPEQITDITDSVRKGQSWHAYQEYKKHKEQLEKLSIELDAAKQRVAELEKIATDYALKFQKAQDALKYVVLMRKSEQEAADNNLIDSECHVAELEEALRDKQALLEASEKRNAKLQSENAYIRNRYKELDLLIGKNILVMQAAIIEWQATGDAKSGLAWIYNTLFGPGELPDESEKDAQAYFNRKYAPIDEKLMALHKWFWEQSEAERAAGIRIKGE
ncbi:hypothetical protein U7Q41_000830 [Escherichia coli]|nr:hypothetical protein [Escherichia coli]